MKTLSHMQLPFDKLPTDVEYWKRRRRWSYSGSSVPSEKKEETLEANSITVNAGNIADKFFYGSYSSLFNPSQGFSITANRSNHHTPNGYDDKNVATLPCTDGHNGMQVTGKYDGLNHGLKFTTNWCSVTHVVPRTIPSCSSCSTYSVMSSCYSSPRMSDRSVSNCQLDNLQHNITESCFDVKNTVSDQGKTGHISLSDNSKKGCIQSFNFASNVQMLCNGNEDVEHQLYHKKCSSSSENITRVDIEQSRKSFDSSSALKSKSLTSIAAYPAGHHIKGINGSEGSGCSLPLSSEPCADLMPKIDDDFKKRLSSLKFGIGSSRFKTPIVMDKMRHNDLLYVPHKDSQADEFKDSSQSNTWKDKENIDNDYANSNPKSSQMNKPYGSKGFIDSFSSKRKERKFIECDRNALRADQIPAQVCEVGHHAVTDTVIQNREKFGSRHSDAHDSRSLKDRANTNILSSLLPVKNFESRCVQLTSNTQMDGACIQNDFGRSTSSEKTYCNKECLPLKLPKKPADNPLEKVNSYREGTPADFDKIFKAGSLSETSTPAFRRSFTENELNNLMLDRINRETAEKQPAISYPLSPKEHSHKEKISTNIQTISSQNDASIDTSIALQMQVKSNADVFNDPNGELPVKESPSTEASKGTVALDKLQTVEKLDRKHEKIEKHLKRTEADIEVLNEIIREASHRLEVKCQLKQKLLKEKSRIANKRDNISKESFGIRDCPRHSSGTVLDFSANAGSAVVIKGVVNLGDFRKSALSAGLLEKTIIQQDGNIVIPVCVASDVKCLSPSSADIDALIFSKTKTSQKFLHNSAEGINFGGSGREKFFEDKSAAGTDVLKGTVWLNSQSEIVHGRVRSASVPPRQRRKTKKARDLLHSGSSSVQLICSDVSDDNLCEPRSRSSSPTHGGRRRTQRRRTSPTECLLKEYLHRSSSSDVDIEGLDSFELVKLTSFPLVSKNDESAERA